MTKVKFIRIDSWNRPIFRNIDKKEYFGSTYKLFDYEANENEVLNKVTEKDLTYFGNSFDCEPMGTNAGEITIIKTEKSPYEIIKERIFDLQRGQKSDYISGEIAGLKTALIILDEKKARIDLLKNKKEGE